jgi:hypothetical protein
MQPPSHSEESRQVSPESAVGTRQPLGHPSPGIPRHCQEPPDASQAASVVGATSTGRVGLAVQPSRTSITRMAAARIALTPKLSRRRRGSMILATDRSGGRLGRVVRPTLCHQPHACKREAVVAPRQAAPDANGRPPWAIGSRRNRSGSRSQHVREGRPGPARAALMLGRTRKAERLL